MSYMSITFLGVAYVVALLACVLQLVFEALNLPRKVGPSHGQVRGMQVGVLASVVTREQEVF